MLVVNLQWWSFQLGRRQSNLLTSYHEAHEYLVYLLTVLIIYISIQIGVVWGFGEVDSLSIETGEPRQFYVETVLTINDYLGLGMPRPMKVQLNQIPHFLIGILFQGGLELIPELVEDRFIKDFFDFDDLDLFQLLGQDLELAIERAFEGHFENVVFKVKGWKLFDPGASTIRILRILFVKWRQDVYFAAFFLDVKLDSSIWIFALKIIDSYHVWLIGVELEHVILAIGANLNHFLIFLIGLRMINHPLETHFQFAFIVKVFQLNLVGFLTQIYLVVGAHPSLLNVGNTKALIHLVSVKD